eukprot:gene25683-32168_t
MTELTFVKAVELAFSAKYFSSDVHGAQNISSVIYCLGHFTPSYTSLPSATRTALSDGVEQYSPLRDQDLSLTLYGLALMSCEWTQLDKYMASSLVSSLGMRGAFENSHTSTPQAVANTFWGLGVMNATWHTLPRDNLTQILIDTLPQSSARHLSATLFGLSLLNVKWSEVSEKCREVVSKVVVERCQDGDSIAEQV